MNKADIEKILKKHQTLQDEHAKLKNEFEQLLKQHDDLRRKYESLRMRSTDAQNQFARSAQTL